MLKKQSFFSLKVIIIFLSLLGIALLTFLFNSQNSQGPKKASDIIWRMFSSAKAGDVENYLQCFTKNSQSVLESTRRERKGQRFQEYIKESAQNIKGVSIINKREENESQRVYDIEVVYIDRNELHTVFLQKTNKGWRISRISKPAVVKPEIPYLKRVIGENT
ncbi:MAG: hypothetical protein ACMUJM_10360 [bacterium]